MNWGPGAPRRRTSASNWNKPLAWNAAHAEFFAQHGRRQRVFCASLADVFDNQVDPAWRADLLELIDRTPNLDWLLLTKRIGNVADMLPNGWLMEHTNVWLGASIVNQVEADRDIPKLVALHAAVKFLSMEPLLGPVDLRGNLPGERALRWYRPMLNMLDWVIVGGESGPAARPMHPDWARDLRDQCTAAGVPFLFKQWGEWLPATEGRSVLGKTLILEGAAPLPDKPQWHGFEGGQQVARVGKKAAGRQLDGAQHDGYPSAKSGTF